MDEFELDDLEEFYPPIRCGEKEVGGYLFRVEETLSGGLTLLAVFVKQEAFASLKKEEALSLLVSHGILVLSDEDFPEAELSFFTSEGEEFAQLDIVLADEDYVYATCPISLFHD